MADFNEDWEENGELYTGTGMIDEFFIGTRHLALGTWNLALGSAVCTQQFAVGTWHLTLGLWHLALSVIRIIC